MKINDSKTQSLIVGRSRTCSPPHPPLVFGGSMLSESSSLRILGVTLDTKLTFESHIRSVSASASQRLGILRKASRIFNDPTVTRTCFMSFVLPLLEYCAPVWSSAACSHLRLLDRVWAGANRLTDVGPIVLGHRRSVGSLCMLYKIRSNPCHYLHRHLPPLRVHPRSTRASLMAHPLTLAALRPRTEQYSRSFLPSTVGLWNSLDPTVFDDIFSVDVFKSRCNVFLLGR